MLVRPGSGAVEEDPLQVRVLQFVEDAPPDPFSGPTIEPSPATVPVAEAFGEIAPRGPGLGDPEDGVDEEAVVLSGHARLSRLAWQITFNVFPVIIRYLVTTHGALARKIERIENTE
jgi:hypothetical protein